MRNKRLSRVALAVVVFITVAAGCAASTIGPARKSEIATQKAPEQLRVQVLEVLSHDANAYTEGLEFSGTKLYESTGLENRSSVRVGSAGHQPTDQVKLDAPLFGEGITLANTSLWQLTWQNGVAIERDPDTLLERRRISYVGEGWGLCAQPSKGRLVMSNGSDTLTFRDSHSFAALGAIAVRSKTSAYSQLNELECVGDKVYANLFQSDKIIRVNSMTGEVEAEIDAAGLLSPQERKQTDVLNGIAAIPNTDEFLLTGKLWPKMFRVRLVPISG